MQSKLEWIYIQIKYRSLGHGYFLHLQAVLQFLIARGLKGLWNLHTGNIEYINSSMLTFHSSIEQSEREKERGERIKWLRNTKWAP